MLKTKIAVLVSGGGTNLQQLLEAMEEGRLSHGEISLVISDQADAYALVRAMKYNIPTAVIQRKSISDKAQFFSQPRKELKHRHIFVSGIDGIIDGMCLFSPLISK